MEEDIKAYCKSAGALIRNLRQQKFCGSLCAFAAKNEISSSTLSRIELGDSEAQLQNLDKIAKGFGMTLSELFYYIESNV